MERCKFFYDCNESVKLGETIDNWIVSNNIKVTRMKTVATGRLDHHVTVVIFYEDLNDTITEKILQTLYSLQSFNKLSDRIINIFSEKFGVDCKKLCIDNGIVYNIE